MNFSEADIEELAAESCLRNEALDITGYLHFSQGMFVQYIEGREFNLKLLLEKVAKDERHKIIFTLWSTSCEARLFSDWGMCYHTKSELRKFNLHRYVEHNILNIKENHANKKNCQKLVWEHIQTIADIKSEGGIGR